MGALQSRITESRRFTVDGYTVTFAAGVKRGEAVVVFGIMTGLETVPVLTLEKKWGCFRPFTIHCQKVRRKTCHCILPDRRLKMVTQRYVVVLPGMKMYGCGLNADQGKTGELFVTEKSMLLT